MRDKQQQRGEKDGVSQSKLKAQLRVKAVNIFFSFFLLN